jgi:hypothetical protein
VPDCKQTEENPKKEVIQCQFVAMSIFSEKKNIMKSHDITQNETEHSANVYTCQAKEGTKRYLIIISIPEQTYLEARDIQQNFCHG